MKKTGILFTIFIIIGSNCIIKAQNPTTKAQSTIGAWKSIDIPAKGTLPTRTDMTLRQFFSLKNKAGNLEVIWQDNTTFKIYLMRFGTNFLNPIQIELPTPAESRLLAATNDDQDNVYYAIYQKYANNDNDLFMLCSADKSGKKIKQQSFKSEFSINLFEEFGATMVCKGDVLGLMFARTLLAGSDGLNHQSGSAATFSKTSLALISNHGQTSGHSFDNFLMISSTNEFVGMDLGDNYPRGINVHRFPLNAGGIDSKVVYTFKTHHGEKPINEAGRKYEKYTEISNNGKTFYKWSNDNDTYTELGGMIEVEDGYLVIFAGEPDKNGNSINNARATNYTDSRNLGFVKVSKQFEKYNVRLKDLILSSGKEEKGGFFDFGGGWSLQENIGINWLTKYQNAKSENVQHIKTSKLPNGNILIIYELKDISTVVTKSFMMTIDANGKIVIPATEIPENIKLNRRDDIICIGKQVILVQKNKTDESKLQLNVLNLK